TCALPISNLSEASVPRASRAFASLKPMKPPPPVMTIFIAARVRAGSLRSQERKQRVFDFPQYRQRAGGRGTRGFASHRQAHADPADDFRCAAADRHRDAAHARIEL